MGGGHDRSRLRFDCTYARPPTTVIRDSRAARAVLGFEPMRRAEAGLDLATDRTASFKADPPAAQQASDTSAGTAIAAVFVVLAVLAASVLVTGFVSAAVLVGLFGIPYAAFLLVYPAIVTLSGFLRALPSLAAFARLPKDRLPIFLGGLIGAILTLPATYYLAKWGVEGFGLFLPGCREKRGLHRVERSHGARPALGADLDAAGDAVHFLRRRDPRHIRDNAGEEQGRARARRGGRLRG